MNPAKGNQVHNRIVEIAYSLYESLDGYQVPDIPEGDDYHLERRKWIDGLNPNGSDYFAMLKESVKGGFGGRELEHIVHWILADQGVFVVADSGNLKKMKSPYEGDVILRNGEFDHDKAMSFVQERGAYIMARLNGQVPEDW